MFIIVTSDDNNFYIIDQFSFDDNQHTEIIFIISVQVICLKQKSEKKCNIRRFCYEYLDCTLRIIHKYVYVYVFIDQFLS